MTEKCEPPPELRGVDGWHWVANSAGKEVPIRWNAGVSGWWDDPVPIGPEYAHRDGYRYLAPCPPPATVAALVEALEAAQEALTITADATGYGVPATSKKVAEALAAYREAAR